MVIKDYIFTSESVSEGHPDKVADQISDAILDEHIKGDKKSRVALETLVTTDRIVLSGEITSTQKVDYEKTARQVVADIGYTVQKMGFDHIDSNCQVFVHTQSPDISQGVTEGQGLFAEQGAGDQGMMFGYAVDETSELMPMPILLAHKLVKRLADVRRSGDLTFLRPDSKSQVTIQYVDSMPKRVDAIVISTQHTDEATHDQITEGVIETTIKKVIPAGFIDKNTKIYVNPTGRFVVGGPSGDTGLTGRKIIVDTYGGMGRHGGGAFSGKDPSKVDRSAAYMARYIAKNIVAAGLARRCEVQLAYAIGVAEPVSVLINTFGTGTLSEDKISDRVRKVFNLKPAGIIEMLDLLRPIYRSTSNYGHFGREDAGFVWEMTNKAAALKG
ncbi:MAG TPA: methionine adenosyltransferase [Spirochaetota bacterium]|nr:methionine adenosyltransferase [Spirochaetota bacterium]HOD14060.1 methionine adenosyltransferase [Spirochaetota bacterium]HPN12652.1 methionine adenosyltransferase [Spirochaetota bacterium]HQL82636.1 methionine adenosyltransferase [Spirochaetota bacterium]